MNVAFVDSNILIYAHDLDTGARREPAATILSELWDAGTGQLSVPILQEFCVNVTQKLATPVARDGVRNRQDPWCVGSPRHDGRDGHTCDRNRRSGLNLVLGRPHRGIG